MTRVFLGLPLARVPSRAAGALAVLQRRYRADGSVARERRLHGSSRWIGRCG